MILKAGYSPFCAYSKCGAHLFTFCIVSSAYIGVSARPSTLHASWPTQEGWQPSSSSSNLTTDGRKATSKRKEYFVSRDATNVCLLEAYVSRKAVKEENNLNNVYTMIGKLTRCCSICTHESRQRKCGKVILNRD